MTSPHTQVGGPVAAGDQRRPEDADFVLPLGERIRLFGPDAILSSQEWASMRGTSDRVNQRERMSGTGCPYVMLSAKRIGYRYGDCTQFLRHRRVGAGAEMAA